MTKERVDSLLDDLEREARAGAEERRRMPRAADDGSTAGFRKFDKELADSLRENNLEALYDRTAAWRAFSGCLWDADKSKVSFLNRNGDLIATTMTDYVTVDSGKTFGQLIRHEAYERLWASASSQGRSQIKALIKRVQADFASLIRTYRQVNLLQLQVDMFAEAPSIHVEQMVAHVTLTYEDFASRVSGRRRRDDLIRRYVSEHFPEFFSFLDFLVAARFAVDRRRAFLWINKRKDWGKGFLIDCLRELGLVLEVSAKEIDKAFAGDPVGIRGAEALRAWILFVDEFKAVIAEYKQLNNHVMLSPKFQPRARLPVYAKVFASAETVASLVGEGVEGQFADRFSVLPPHESDAPLSRLFAPGVDNLQYFDAVVVAAAHHLDMRVQEYRALGREKSNSRANLEIQAWRSTHEISLLYPSLEESINEHAARLRSILEDHADWAEAVERREEELDQLRRQQRSQIAGDREGAFEEVQREQAIPPPRLPSFLASTRLLREALDRHAVRGYVKSDAGKSRVIVVKSASAVVEAYLAAAVGEKNRAKVGYKIGQIVEKLRDVKAGDRGRFTFYRTMDTDRGEQASGMVIFRRF
jgi:hypothetical protein